MAQARNEKMKNWLQRQPDGIEHLRVKTNRQQSIHTVNIKEVYPYKQIPINGNHNLMVES